MPRLKLAPDARPGQPPWLPFAERRWSPLYVGRQQYRKLVVLLDDDVLNDAAVATWGKEYLLAGLLTLDVIDCSRYADADPPDAAIRRQDDFMGEYVPGWAALSPDDGSGYRSARTATEYQITDHAVFGNAPDVAEHDTKTAAYGDRDPADAAAQRRADALAAMVANSIGADLFITNRPYLYAISWNLAKGVTIVGVDDAPPLAAIGLYLRAQDQYVTSRQPGANGSHTMNRGLFFWVGARDLLPSAMAMVRSMCPAFNRWRRGQPPLSRTVGLATGRAGIADTRRGTRWSQQAAKQRHRRQSVVVVGCHPAPTDGGGRCDGTGRACGAPPHKRCPHRRMAAAGVDRRRDDRRSDAWCALPTGHGRTARSHHPSAPTKLDHGEAMQALGVGQGRRRDRTLVSLPATADPDLRAAFTALGGLADWGVEELIPGQLHFDPGVLLEQLLPRVLGLLNCVVDETPVETLAHVSLPPSDSLPPTGVHSGPFVELNRQSVRWQLGL